LSILALIAALLAQNARPPGGRQPLLAFYGRMCLSAAKRLNAGDRNSGILAWVALVGALLVPVALVSALAAAIHPAVLWVLEVAFLYGTLRFFSTTASLAAIERGRATAAEKSSSLMRSESRASATSPRATRRAPTAASGTTSARKASMT